MGTPKKIGLTDFSTVSPIFILTFAPFQFDLALRYSFVRQRIHWRHVRCAQCWQDYWYLPIPVWAVWFEHWLRAPLHTGKHIMILILLWVPVHSMQPLRAAQCNDTDMGTSQLNCISGCKNKTTFSWMVEAKKWHNILIRMNIFFSFLQSRREAN